MVRIGKDLVLSAATAQQCVRSLGTVVLGGGRLRSIRWLIDSATSPGLRVRCCQRPPATDPWGLDCIDHPLGGAAAYWLWVMMRSTVSLRVSGEVIVQGGAFGLYHRVFAFSDLVSLTWKDRGRRVAHTVWRFTGHRPVNFAVSGASYSIPLDAMRRFG
jgi:hypothetical protein